MEFQIFTRDAYAVDIAVASHIFIQAQISFNRKIYNLVKKIKDFSHRARSGYASGGVV